MGVGHYENFPVASALLPARLRQPVRAIYRFARTADDFADEGDADVATRLERLDALEGEIDALVCGQPNSWPDLQQAMSRHRLPVAPLRALLSAFRQDVVQTRYLDYESLLDYCRRSANPVGRLLLALFERDEPVLTEWSDAICTGLQLVNFWQDIALDWAKGRVYLPQSELAQYGVDETWLAGRRSDERWRQLLRAQTRRAADLLQSGGPLCRALGGRIGLELRMVIEGGLRIAERIEAAGGDVFRHRPRLDRRDWMILAYRAFTHAPARG